MKKSKASLWTVASFAVFICAYIASVLIFRFVYIEDQLTSNSMLGTEIEVPVSLIILSFVFLLILVLLTVFGYRLKNKFMLLLSASYQLLIVMALIMLVITMVIQIANDTLYNILTQVIVILLSPLFGTIWVLGTFFFIAFVPLFVVTVVLTVKTFKQKK